MFIFGRLSKSLSAFGVPIMVRPHYLGYFKRDHTLNNPLYSGALFLLQVCELWQSYIGSGPGMLLKLVLPDTADTKTTRKSGQCVHCIIRPYKSFSVNNILLHMACACGFWIQFPVAETSTHNLSCQA